MTTSTVLEIDRPRILEACRRWADAMRPPAPARDLLEFASTIIIPENKGTERQYDPYAHPATVAFLIQVNRSVMSDDPDKFRRFALLGPAQDGKTLAIVIVLLWLMVEHGLSVALVYPDMQVNDDSWSRKFLPVIKANGFEYLLPKEGAGSETGLAASQAWTNGAALFRLGAGGKNQAAQSNRTVFCVIKDERDDIRPVPASKADQRTQGQGDNYIIIDTSTIKDSLNSAMLKMYDQSTGTNTWLGCSSCHRYFLPDWFEHVKYDATDAITARDSVRLVCPHCGHAMTEDERRDACRTGIPVDLGQTVDASGTVVGEGPRSLICGINWSGLVSHRKSLHRMVEEYVVAETALKGGDHTAMETWYQDTLGLPFIGARKALRGDPARLASLSADMKYAARQLPPGWDERAYRFALIDCQHRELYSVGFVWNPAIQSWAVVSHGYHPICGAREQPTADMYRAALDRAEADLMDGWATDRNSLVYPQWGGVDVKDGTNPHRAVIQKWIDAHPAWYGIYGQDDRQSKDSASGRAIKRIPGVLTLTENDGRQFLSINTHAMKTRVLTELMSEITTDTHRGMIPNGEAADGHLIKELCSEEFEETETGGKWVRRYRHNHRLDLCVYGLAMALWIYDYHQSQTGGHSAADFVGGMQ